MLDQLSLFAKENTPQSVSQVTRYIGQLFDRDSRLQDVWVEGEVSNYKRAASGHLYFTLKDSQSQLKCVMWKSDAVRLRVEPQQGAQLIAQGKIGIYAPTGEYQLYAKVLQPVGLGDLHRQFELLKAKLEAEGLFDTDRKRPIPSFPRRIGIVTSPDAAGFQDMLNILLRRFPSAHLILSPTMVQGTTAPPQIVAAIQRLNALSDIDVMVIARGGGSLEDLWCFNDERVVRAVADSRIPTVTGVGHEIDYTLVDFAADLRAPTPSAAAELITPDRQELLLDLQALSNRLARTVQDRLQAAQDDLKSQQRTLRLVSPLNRIRQTRQQVDDLHQRLMNALKARQQAQRQRLELLHQRLQSASPQALLERGYTILSDAQGQRITSVQAVNLGDSVTIQLKDGLATATVTQKETPA